MIKVSVVTAVYNRQDTVGQALDSVLAQSHPLIESVVVDGASTDGTLDIVERYRPRLGALVSAPDRGIYDALNKGLRLASGDVVGFLHADDLFADNDVVSDIATRLEDPQVDAVYGDLVYVDATDVDKVIRHWTAGHFDASMLGRGWMPPHPTIYIRRSVYERLGGFDTHYRIAADYDTMVRFFRDGNFRAAYLPRVLVRMRVGGISNRSLRSVWRKSAEDLEIMRSHGIGGIGTLLSKNLGKISQFWRR